MEDPYIGRRSHDRPPNTEEGRKKKEGEQNYVTGYGTKSAPSSSCLSTFNLKSNLISRQTKKYQKVSSVVHKCKKIPYTERKKGSKEEKEPEAEREGGRD